MKIHRFYQPNIDIDEEVLVIDDEEFLHQADRVLRMEAGDELVLFDGNLNEVFCEIQSLDEKQGRLKVVKTEKNSAEPDSEVSLYCSILKKENFELVCQKATEIGVKKIVPVISQRTVKTGLKTDRLEKIIIEAAEQSGRGIIPELAEPVQFEKVIQNQDSNDLNILFDHSGVPVEDLLSTDYGLQSTLFVGPEGGWTDKEIEQAKQNDFQIVSLGKTILRAETAAIIGSFQVIIKQPR